MSPASLDRCHCQSMRCWCTSIDLLSGTTVSLSQSCQLYNGEGVLTVVFLPLVSLVVIEGSLPSSILLKWFPKIFPSNLQIGMRNGMGVNVCQRRQANNIDR